MSVWGCRGWLADPDVPIFATSVFSFHGDQQQQQQQQQHQDKQLVAAGGVARTSLIVSKPTVFRVAAEPALASDAQLKIRVFASPSSSSSSKELVSAPLPATGAIAEAKENNLFTLLQPGSYLVAFEGSEPFLTTIGGPRPRV